MKIVDGLLEGIESDEDHFVRTYCEYAESVLRQARLYPKFAKLRIIEAHGAWTNDLHRVTANEANLEDGMDHFKRCGHLTFWLRRMSPLVEALDLTLNLGDAEGHPLAADEKAFRELLFGYANEYLAFDFGYQFCLYYERAKPGGSQRAQNMVLNEDYLRTMCHFLKYKTVSPHAVFLVFKSLFHR